MLLFPERLLLSDEVFNHHVDGERKQTNIVFENWKLVTFVEVLMLSIHSHSISVEGWREASEHFINNPTRPLLLSLNLRLGIRKTIYPHKIPSTKRQKSEMPPRFPFSDCASQAQKKAFQKLDCVFIFGAFGAGESEGGGRLTSEIPFFTLFISPFSDALMIPPPLLCWLQFYIAKVWRRKSFCASLELSTSSESNWLFSFILCVNCPASCPL